MQVEETFEKEKEKRPQMVEHFLLKILERPEE